MCMYRLWPPCGEAVGAKRSPRIERSGETLKRATANVPGTASSPAPPTPAATVRVTVQRVVHNHFGSSGYGLEAAPPLQRIPPLSLNIMADVPASQLSKEQMDELLCTYAALILHDEGTEIEEDKMNKLITAAGCSVEAYWPMLMAKMVKNVGIDDLIKMGGGGGGGGAAAGGEAAGGGGAAAGGAKEEKKAAVEEEEEADMDFDLFG